MPNDSFRLIPTWQEAQAVAQDIQGVMVEDSLVSSHPVYQPVNDPIEIAQLFDNIAYVKVIVGHAQDVPSISKALYNLRFGFWSVVIECFDLLF